ncbi:hypothetical protein TUMSATVNIG1_56960 (plasmid) [Vibrio nigripulchritudo]|uniref:Wadjet anti-phage system protein JetD domain-containing protein n=1 Tax=Vibrio nigripulchritudo TaxID=28173 RepID=UPI00190C28D4|nr:Wadjet anti-phage system protein JetD domain-containing protein [Vibrio nigripulchritudo]BCL73713.1 hypothetical protein VNTUMSATTG_56500 [Vibrio nigripulchritudo]BDU35087.1 hypothetical protein TUMSATVNIG1_56960 [Vibrio nigripulchritudo]
MINTLLEKLIRACNKPNKLIERQKFKITHKRYDFYHDLTIGERIKCHEQLEFIGNQTGALRVEYAAKAFGDEDSIDSIELTDVRQLCHFLNIYVCSDETKLAIEAIEDIKDACPRWLCDTLTEIQKGWSEGKKPYHCSPNDKDKIQDACKFIIWVESISPSQLVSVDIRTVSVQLFSDSKRLENLASKVKSMMKKKLPEEVMVLSAIEVLTYIGISRFPPLFRFKGNLSVQFKSGHIDTTHCWPNIGVSPDGVVDIALNHPPRYVLFIENQTTFERYCREVADNGLVFYTNGFPSRAWQSLYSKIETSLPPETPIFHWGDIDVGGYQILAFMDSLFSRAVTPYMMNPSELVSSSEKTVNKDKLVKSLDKVRTGPIRELRNALYSMDGDDIYWIEQESIEIKAITINIP